MKAAILIFTALTVLFPTPSLGQGLELGLNWSMGAVVSANDYTNGATDGTPSLNLAFSFNDLAVEIFYKNYQLSHTYENSLGKNDLEFDQKIFGMGIRFTHAEFFLTRFGLQYVDTQTKAINDNGKKLDFDFDEPTIGLYGGGGIQIPLTKKLSFQTIGQLETSQSDLTVLGLLFGFRYQMTKL